MGEGDPIRRGGRGDHQRRAFPIPGAQDLAVLDHDVVRRSARRDHPALVAVLRHHPRQPDPVVSELLLLPVDLPAVGSGVLDRDVTETRVRLQALREPAGRLDGEAFGSVENSGLS